VTLISTKPILAALMRQTAARVPFWFMRQAGRYLPEYRAVRAQARDFIALCLNPKLAAEITLQPIRRYGMDAAILFADILLVPHALGCGVTFREGDGPQLEPIRDGRRIAALETSIDRIGERLSAVGETLTRVATQLDPATTLIGFAGSPWTVASYMVEGRGGHDFSQIRRMARVEQRDFSALCDVLERATIAYLRMQIDAGAEVIQLFDTWSGVLPSDEFERWCIAPTKRIVAALKASHAAIPIIGFPRLAGANLEAYVRHTGIDGVGLDPTVPLDWAGQNLQPRVTLQGNLDPLLLTLGGDEMERCTRRIIAAWSQGPFIFNLGHGITPDVSPDHVARLSNLVRNVHLS
jgi:uroporphyrinogen decarboxylase